MTFKKFQKERRAEEKSFISVHQIGIAEELCRRFKQYKHCQLVVTGSPVSIKANVEEVEIAGFPYPYLLCKLSNGGGSITVNMISKIAYKQNSKDMTVNIKGCETPSLADSTLEYRLICHN